MLGARRHRGGDIGAGPLAAERPSDSAYPVNVGGLAFTGLTILTVALAIAMGLGFAMTAGGPSGLAGDPGSWAGAALPEAA